MVDLNLPGQRTMLTPAPVWKRVLAFIADLLVIQLVIFSPFSASLSGSLPSSDNIMENYRYLAEQSDMMSQITMMILFMFGLMFAYFFLFDLKLGQTPGKMLFKLYVVPMIKKDSLTIWRLISRNLAILPVFPFTLLWIIDPLYMVFSGKRLSDILTKTLVVEEISI
ncbi:RDD family protein [Candidatus Woesearchaeota archaeon]|nr:RDD family protein [Candidatus Woesearchaeota archaeon]